TNDFYSPYASVEAPLGDHSWHYYALPTHLFYAVVGWLGHTIHLPPFITLGLANGIGVFLFLLATYRLLVAVAPRVPKTAFSLFALGGGIAAPVYAVCAAFGGTNNPAFERWFNPFAAYSLIEGAH